MHLKYYEITNITAKKSIQLMDYKEPGDHYEGSLEEKKKYLENLHLMKVTALAENSGLLIFLFSPIDAPWRCCSLSCYLFNLIQLFRFSFYHFFHIL